MVRLTLNLTAETSRVGQLEETNVTAVQNIIDPTAFLSFSDLFERLGSHWYSGAVYTYVDPCVAYKVS